MNYSQNSDKAGYKVLGLTGDNQSEHIPSVTINSNETSALLAQFLTPSAAFDGSLFKGGVWNASLYVYASGVQSTTYANLYLQVYKYSASNTATLIAQTGYNVVPYTVTPGLMEFTINIPTNVSFVASDRLKLRVMGYNSYSQSGTKTQTIYCCFEGVDRCGYTTSTVPIYVWADANQNTYLGVGALKAKSGNNDTAVGYHSLLQITNDNQNTAIGSLAGSSLTSGNNNTLLGYNAQTSTATSSNQIVLGNSAVTVLRCQQTSISGLSDGRDKKDVRDLDSSLDWIRRLRPVSFTWNSRDGSRVGDRDMGFIAQEVLEQEDREYLRIVSSDDKERYEMAPARLIPLLVKAVQELAARI
jgi:hypothetical protein